MPDYLKRKLLAAAWFVLVAAFLGGMGWGVMLWFGMMNPYG